MGKINNRNCSVHGCHTVKGLEPEIHFHKYPRSNKATVNVVDRFGVLEKVDRRTAWTLLLKRTNPTEAMVVCSKHFMPQDYFANGHKQIAPKLKATAVPTRNLPLSSEPPKKARGRSQVVSNDKIKTEDNQNASEISSTNLKYINSQREFLDGSIGETEFFTEKQQDEEETSEIVEEFDNLENCFIKTEIKIEENPLNEDETGDQGDFPEFEFRVVKEEQLHDDDDINSDNEDNFHTFQNCIANIKEEEEESALKPIDNDDQGLELKEIDYSSINNERFLLPDPLLKEVTEIESKSIKCHLCFIEFEDSSHLKPHLLSHIVEESFNSQLSYKCKKCNKKFKSKKTVENHLLSQSCKTTLECKFCREGFHLKKHLQAHLLTHKREKLLEIEGGPFKCKKCNARYRCKETLKTHLFNHSGKESFTCEFCKKTFARNTTLQRHLLIHMTDKPFECEYCKRKFRNVKSYDQHLKIHEGLKNKFWML